MSQAHSGAGWIRPLWVVPSAAVVYVIAQAVTGTVLSRAPLEPPQMPQAVGAGRLMAWGLVSAFVIALGVAPLARRLGGGLIARWSVLAAFIYLVYTVNTAIETVIFTRIGGQAWMAANGLPPALFCAAVLAMIRPVGDAPPDLAGWQSGGGLAWRLAVAWLAFPAAYLVFGMLIAPFVIDAYSTDNSLIVIPPIGTIVAVQLVRSMLFLLPTLAVIERWTGGRLGLWLVLAWAHTALVGLAGLVIPSDLFTPTLRLTHSLEIAADSFVYMGITVAVLAPKRPEP